MAEEQGMRNDGRKEEEEKMEEDIEPIKVNVNYDHVAFKERC